MSSTAPDLSDNVSYQDLGADVYEIVDASQTPVGVVSLVGETEWVAVTRRGTVVGCCASKTNAATALITDSATHSRWLSLPKLGIDARQD